MRKRINLFKGLKALYKLSKNKSDNDSYIKVNVYLNGDCIAPTVAEWSKTPHGKRYLKGERLPLNKKFKKDTVGWVRQKFVGKYDKSIDLVNASVPKTPYMAYVNFLQDTHDISHIMSQYGQEGLGELCRIEFEISQSWQRGFQLVSWMFQLKALTITKSWKQFQVVRAMIKEAQQRAKDSVNLDMIDWFKYLDEPYEYVRESVACVPPYKLYFTNQKWDDWADKHYDSK